MNRACVSASGLLFAFLSAVNSTPASAAVIPDATGDEFSGNAILDIRSVEVTNDASNITFTIELAGDPVATNWGKYMIGLDSIAGIGDTAGNGWGRPISMSSGMDYWIGSWADNGGGADLHRFAAAWSRTHATDNPASPLAAPVVTSSGISLTLPLAALGLSPSDTFTFDAYTAGGGNTDSANDASSNPAPSTSTWPGPYDSGANVSTYTVVVPEPGALTLVAVGALTLLRRRA